MPVGGRNNKHIIMNRRNKPKHHGILVILLKSLTIGIIHTIAVIVEMIFFPILFLFKLKQSRKEVKPDKKLNTSVIS